MDTRVPWIDAEHPHGLGELEQLAGVRLADATKQRLFEEAKSVRHLRGRFEVVNDEYIYAVIPVPHVVRERDEVVYLELDVVLSDHALVTVRKRHGEGFVFEPEVLRETAPEKHGPSSGEMFFRLMEDVADAYSNVMNDLQDEIDELERAIGIASTDRIHKRHSSLRRDLLDVRRQLLPLLAAMRAILDERIDIKDQIFPSEIEQMMKDVRDDMQRVADSIPLVADLLSGVRDYHQGMIAQRQNDVMQKLTVIAALLLVPTLIVGVYGQNFHRIPETDWSWGYEWSWGLIIVTTLIQLVIFRRLGWLGGRKSNPEEGADLGSVLEEE